MFPLIWVGHCGPASLRNDRSINNGENDNQMDAYVREQSAYAVAAHEGGFADAFISLTDKGRLACESAGIGGGTEGLRVRGV